MLTAHRPLPLGMRIREAAEARGMNAIEMAEEMTALLWKTHPEIDPITPGLVRDLYSRRSTVALDRPAPSAVILAMKVVGFPLAVLGEAVGW